jgi:dipeptidase
LVLASDQEAENYTGEERKDFLTACNEKHAEKMNQLALDHIGALVDQGLGLSALTYDITKDI